MLKKREAQIKQGCTKATKIYRTTETVMTTRIMSTTTVTETTKITVAATAIMSTTEKNALLHYCTYP